MALTRGIDPATLAALSGVFNVVIMVRLDWPGSMLRLHSGVGILRYEGQNWSGLGRFGAIDTPEESGGLASSPLTLRLIGAPDEMDAYLDDPIRDRDAWVAVAVTSERAGGRIIGAPIPIFAGYMDALRDEAAAADGNITRSIVLSVAAGPSQRQFAVLAHTAEDQAAAFPGDTAGRHVINAEANSRRRTWPE